MSESWLTTFINFIFPLKQQCSLCGQTITDRIDYGICPACRATLPYIEGHLCERCGVSIEHGTLCSDCHTGNHCFIQSRSLLRYDSGGKNLVGHFKFRFQPSLAKPLAEQLISRVLEPQGWNYDLIVPVPLHLRGLKDRGYNQSELLAKELGKLAGKPTTNALRKVKGRVAQHHLDRMGRWQASAGVYKCVNPAAIQGKTVLLVDDVYTTGATVHHCADELLKAGATGIYVVTIAR